MLVFEMLARAWDVNHRPVLFPGCVSLSYVARKSFEHDDCLRNCCASDRVTPQPWSSHQDIFWVMFHGIWGFA